MLSSSEKPSYVNRNALIWDLNRTSWKNFDRKPFYYSFFSIFAPNFWKSFCDGRENYKAIEGSYCGGPSYVFGFELVFNLIYVGDGRLGKEWVREGGGLWWTGKEMASVFSYYIAQLLQYVCYILSLKINLRGKSFRRALLPSHPAPKAR